MEKLALTKGAFKITYLNLGEREAFLSIGIPSLCHQRTNTVPLQTGLYDL